MSYLTPLPGGSSLSIRALATWTTNQTYVVYQGGVVHSLLGQLAGFSNFGVEEEPAPKWRGNLFITWVEGGFSLTPSMTWVGHGLLSANAVTPQSGLVYQWLLAGYPDATSSLPPGTPPRPDSAAQQAAKQKGYIALPFNSVPAYFLFGLNAAYNFEHIPNLQGLQVYLQVNNLFNRQPPIAYGGVGGTNPAYYDTLGMAYRAGFRLSF